MGLYIACAIHRVNRQWSGGTPSLNLSAQMLIDQSYGEKIHLINYTEGLVGARRVQMCFCSAFEYFPGLVAGLVCFIFNGTPQLWLERKEPAESCLPGKNSCQAVGDSRASPAPAFGGALRELRGLGDFGFWVCLSERRNEITPSPAAAARWCCFAHIARGACAAPLSVKLILNFKWTRANFTLLYFPSRRGAAARAWERSLGAAPEPKRLQTGREEQPSHGPLLMEALPPEPSKAGEECGPCEPFSAPS